MGPGNSDFCHGKCHGKVMEFYSGKIVRTLSFNSPKMDKITFTKYKIISWIILMALKGTDAGYIESFVLVQFLINIFVWFGLVSSLQR